MRTYISCSTAQIILGTASPFMFELTPNTEEREPNVLFAISSHWQTICRETHKMHYNKYGIGKSSANFRFGNGSRVGGSSEEVHMVCHMACHRSVSVLRITDTGYFVSNLPL